MFIIAMVLIACLRPGATICGGSCGAAMNWFLCSGDSWEGFCSEFHYCRYSRWGYHSAISWNKFQSHTICITMTLQHRP